MQNMHADTDASAYADVDNCTILYWDADNVTETVAVEDVKCTDAVWAEDAQMQT